MSKIKRIIIFFMPFIAVPFLLPAIELFRKYSLPCMLNFFTGIYCIGCGGTRCIEALLRGNLILAVRENLIVFSGAVFLALLWLQAVTGKRIIPTNRIFYITVTGIFIIYAVLRNFIPEIAPL